MIKKESITSETYKSKNNKMKTLFLILFHFIVITVIGQIPTYYNNVNLSLTGSALKSELSNKITVTHTYQLSYNDIWTVLQQTDLDPNNLNNVFLLYGYNDTDGNPVTDRTRNKNYTGGNAGDWNREHTYAKSLATPSMVTTSPSAGTDAHHLRATDVQQNGNRGSKMFASGSGNAGSVGVYWYPGDEWKGDVARMMMYMYLRYPTQCLPTNVGVGISVASDANMIDLFLQWNAEDTVSLYETNRNNILEGIQGNRNPFIDNPFLATLIWDGIVAQDKWNMTTTINENMLTDYFSVFPNPAHDQINVTVNTNSNSQLMVYNVNGTLVKKYLISGLTQKEIKITELSKGFYLFKFQTEKNVFTKKVVVN
ncbi:MAG: endonuclease [Flavobacteriales bacterium CG18_big_fil_WC_8_21_14_2_50_32_9]|nr:MAG: endonuclease [Flavobacteriales bacterium CG18_big_fil_WC_8_21_14_2_50_32_9]PJC61265.1 MAG: endonuclease [Flavobacteriales bacterium CG_4_9_14_0_2_um_filter_32_27]